MTDEESGIDELMRLQQQFTQKQEEHDSRQKLQEEQGKKAQGVLKGLKDLQFSMTIDQLKSVAKPEVIKEVIALSAKPDTEDLRKMISDMAEEMENKLEAISAANPEVTPIVDYMRTLNILMDLYYSLQ